MAQSLKLTKFDLDKLKTCSEFIKKMKASEFNNEDQQRDKLIKIVVHTALH